MNMHRLKRLWELVKLFFKALREDGVQYTLHRLVGFLHRRLRSKKGRFLPPRAELERQRREDTSNWPKISICTAIYNTDPVHLKAFLNSFLFQTNQNSELCLADASDSEHADLRQIVADCKSDRIRYLKLDRNGGISENTNAAARLATGSYLALADHDDILSPNACYELAKAAADASILTFAGIEAYAGHLAHEYDYDKRYAATMVIEDTLRALKGYLEEKGLTVKDISGVSTGTVCFRDGMEGGTMYTEVQPGSYLFMDTGYNGVKLPFEDRLFLLASVISTKKDLVVTDAGLKTASVDMGNPALADYPDVERGMSEEHISHIIPNHPYHVNDLVRYIPGHCCTTVNLHDRFYLVNGDDVVDIIEINSRGKSY